MSEIEKYIRATTISEASALLQQPATRIIAGGTDLLLKVRTAKGGPVTVLDISGIQEMDGIWPEKGGVRIGAATRLADIVRSEVLNESALQVLCQGAVLVGSPQIRNLATLGGNLCNAAPSADTSAPLMVLDACAETLSRSGKRTIPMQEFFQGPGKTALGVGEMLVSIFIPYPSEDARSVYLKHSPRRAMDLAMVGVAALHSQRNSRLTRIALSAVAPTPVRALAAELYLNDVENPDEAVIAEAVRLAVETSRPISDVRSSADYRREMVRVLTDRALHQVLGLS